MSQVRIKVAPSRTGPTFEPWTSMPLSSMMMAFEGGTVKIKGQKIREGQIHFFVNSQIFMLLLKVIEELLFNNFWSYF